MTLYKTKAGVHAHSRHPDAFGARVFLFQDGWDLRRPSPSLVSLVIYHKRKASKLNTQVNIRFHE